MKRLLLSICLLLLAVGCPKVERKTYSYDLKARTGEVHFVNLVTDDATKAGNDFMDIVQKFVVGTELEEKNPGWRVQSKELFEESGRLDGRARFTFDDPAGVGLYQHDKKSPHIWCASRGDNETVVATNGIHLDHVLPGCVAWDRKTTQLEVTVKTADLVGGERTLLPQFQKWQAGEELDLAVQPLEGVLSSDRSLDVDALDEQSGGALMGTLGEVMGLDGSLSMGLATARGPMKVEEAERALSTLERSKLRMCYRLALSTDPSLSGQATLHVSVAPTGEVSQATLSGDLRGSAIEECLLETAKELSFPAPGAEAELAWPLTFSP